MKIIRDGNGEKQENYQAGQGNNLQFR